MGLPRLAKIGAPDEGPKLALRWVGPYWLSNGVPHIGSEMGPPPNELLGGVPQIGSQMEVPQIGSLTGVVQNGFQIESQMECPEWFPNWAPQIGSQFWLTSWGSPDWLQDRGH